ncbi:helix-turn-helix domain-containing protein [Salinisphaera sp. USBA-960]|nr:helix-turn-helix domain-containing protein [Salifodinibacter halophilus]NNC25275.1 helix-turn-helix domain-containing protein [Salifodinibacter halophilus]
MHPLAITIQAAADSLAVSPRTVRRMLDDGELIAVHIRGARRVQYASLLDVCRTEKTDPHTGSPATSTHAAGELDDLLAQRTTRKPKRSRASGAPKSTDKLGGASGRVIHLNNC